jgi:hypothetical protein
MLGEWLDLLERLPVAGSVPVSQELVAMQLHKVPITREKSGRLIQRPLPKRSSSDSYFMASRAPMILGSADLAGGSPQARDPQSSSARSRSNAQFVLSSTGGPARMPGREPRGVPTRDQRPRRRELEETVLRVFRYPAFAQASSDRAQTSPGRPLGKKPGGPEPRARVLGEAVAPMLLGGRLRASTSRGRVCAPSPSGVVQRLRARSSLRASGPAGRMTARSRFADSGSREAVP